MRYTVLANGKAVAGAVHLRDFSTASYRGEQLADAKPDAEICIDGTPEISESPLMPAITWRFDRELASWVKTSRR